MNWKIYGSRRQFHSITRFSQYSFPKKHIVAANHNMWSNSAIRECVDVYDELSHFIELPMDRFTHTTHFSERHRKFEVIFIRFSDAYRTIRITSIRIFTSRLVRKRCYFRYCTYLWADLITLVRKKGTGFDIRTKKKPPINQPSESLTQFVEIPLHPISSACTAYFIHK